MPIASNTKFNHYEIIAPLGAGEWAKSIARDTLLLRPLEDATTRPLTVVEHWTALLKK